MAQRSGVEVVSLCKRGSYKKTYLAPGTNLFEEFLPLNEGESTDITVLCMAGNEMVSKKFPFSNKGTCHLSRPSMMSDLQARNLVRDVEKLALNIREYFTGKIIILGPTPRHLVKCCNQDTHLIKDVEGKQVNMEHYTDAVNELLSKSLNLGENMEFVGYKEQFGGSFVKDMLADGVHLKKDAKITMSGFIMTCLGRGESAAKSAVKNTPNFTNLLEAYGVKAKAREERMEETE